MAEVRKVGGVTVNDGKGLLDNEGLIDSLIVDTNDLVKHLTSGQYVAFCQRIVHMTQKLANLKKGLANDLADRDRQIDNLRKRLREAGVADDISAEEYLSKYAPADTQDGQKQGSAVANDKA